MSPAPQALALQQQDLLAGAMANSARAAQLLNAKGLMKEAKLVEALRTRCMEHGADVEAHPSPIPTQGLLSASAKF